MPDWNLLVREQLKGDVGLTQHDEIVAELAGDLEDRYDELRAEGAAESEAIEGALSEVTDWSALARRIRHAKRNPSAMNERTRQLWLPGLASLTAANLLLMLLSSMSLRPREVAELSSAWFPGLALMTAYLPCLVAQPFVSALGAWLSFRAGGGPANWIGAGLFPSIVMLACWCIFIPATAAIERNTRVIQRPIYVVLGGLVWVAPAMMGLLLGSLPFLVIGNLRSSSAMSPRSTRP